MGAQEPQSLPRSCLYIDLNDPRCAAHFTLGRIHDTFDMCLRAPHLCAVYYQLTRDRLVRRAVLHGAAPDEPADLVCLTFQGRPCPPPPVKLRPTG